MSQKYVRVMKNSVSLSDLSIRYNKRTDTIRKFLKANSVCPVCRLKDGNHYDLEVLNFLDKCYKEKYDVEIYNPVYITQTFYIYESKINNDNYEDED